MKLMQKLKIAAVFIILAIIVLIAIPNIIYYRDRGWMGVVDSEINNNQGTPVKVGNEIFSTVIKNRSTILFIDSVGTVRSYQAEYDRKSNILTLVEM
jgi:hypothetical protein